MRGVAVTAAQNLARRILITWSVGQHTWQRSGSCPKSCPRDAYWMKKWVACAAEKWRLPKILFAGCLLLEVLDCMRGVEVPAAQNHARGILIEWRNGLHARQRGGSCPKSCPRDAYWMKKWAACVAKKWRLPKILFAGCLLNEEMHGEPYVATNSYILKNATLYSYRK